MTATPLTVARNRATRLATPEPALRLAYSTTTGDPTARDKKRADLERRSAQIAADQRAMSPAERAAERAAFEVAVWDNHCCSECREQALS
jgi:hypothetical protein